MNYPATRDPVGSRSPGCCYHSWNPHVYPSCRKCLRPLLTLEHHSALLSTCIHDSHLSLCHEAHRSRSAEATPVPLNRFHWGSCSAGATNYIYHCHPPFNTSKFSLNYQLPDNKLRYNSESSTIHGENKTPKNTVDSHIIKPPILDITQRWIGEETKRSLPLHVYKYYLAYIKQYHRRHLKVILFI